MSTASGYPLLCLGNPLLDIQAQGNAELLQKYGLKPNDAILAEKQHVPLYEDLLTNYSAKLIAGGAAQNTARGAQYMLPPSSVVYIGCVGKDKYAETLRKTCDEAGLAVEYRVDEEQPTGRCGVVITGHDRSMCTDLAAANHYKIQHLKQPPIWNLVEKAKVYYVGGFHLTVCVEAIMALAEEASKKEDKVFIINLSAPFIPQFYKDPLDKVVPYCDYIIGNESEALAYAEAHSLKTTSIPEIAQHLAQIPRASSSSSKRPRTVVITQGTLPTIVSAEKASTQSFPVTPIPASEINDTNGAGDAFAGGFVSGIVEGKSLVDCVDRGHWLAGLSVRELGPSFPMPKKTFPGTS